MFEFGFPNAFYILPLPLLLYFALPPIRQQKTFMAVPFFKKFLNTTEIESRTGVSIVKKKTINIITLSIIWISLVTALASPQLIGEPELKIKTARSMMIAVDLSGSMATTDWEIEGEMVSRWDAVKMVMEEFIQRREGDRIGLILFGTEAYLQVPFTNDLKVVNEYLKESEVGMPGEKTAIGNAIGLGVRIFEADSLEKKVMILLTDGVDSGSEINPFQAANTAADDSIKIYTIGIGDPKSSIFDLDEKMLQQIADETGGEYFLAIDRDQLDNVYKTLEDLEPIEFEEETYKPAKLLFHIPLLASIIIILVNQLIFTTLSSLKKNE